MPIPTPDDLLGTKLAGKYTLKRILGKGGMGTVFVGEHAWTGREVAVKLLNPEYAGNEEIVRRFLQEARTAASLKHVHVVDVLDMGQGEDGSVFLVLELLEGEPLNDRLKRGPMSIPEAVEALEPVMDALAHAHDQGITHRDIKPDNIFLSQDPRLGMVPKILDFGIAKVVDDLYAARTGTGQVIGTPYYMSPEQVHAEKDLGPPSDVWSIAVVFYEAVTRERPFVARSAMAALGMIASKEPPRPIREVDPSVPLPIARIIDRALSRVPGQRPTMRELGAALREALGMGKPSGHAIPVVSLSAMETQPITAVTPLPEFASAAFDGLHEASIEPSSRPPAAPIAPVEPTLDMQASTSMAVETSTRSEKPSPSMDRLKVPLAIGAAALLLVALGLGGGVWLLSGGDEGESSAPTSAAGPVPETEATSGEAAEAIAPDGVESGLADPEDEDAGVAELLAEQEGVDDPADDPDPSSESAQAAGASRARSTGDQSGARARTSASQSSSSASGGEASRGRTRTSTREGSTSGSGSRSRGSSGSTSGGRRRTSGNPLEIGL